MRFVTVLLVMLACLVPARADDGAAAAQAAIDGQMRAFLADDGAAAYGYAAPNIKKLFPTVEAFMGMVARGYPPVRRPQAYSFGRTQATGPGALAQQVFITGPDGRQYEAVYTLELQPDGSYRITGCSLRGATALSI